MPRHGPAVLQSSAPKNSLRVLSPELEQKSIEMADVSQNRVLRYVQALRDWIQDHQNLKARSDAQFLIAFLRYCKYDLDLTKERITYFYDYKTNIAPKILKGGLFDDEMVRLCAKGILSSLRQPMKPSGPRIHFTRMSNINPDTDRMEDLFRLFHLRSQVELLTDDNAVICGVIEIIDCKNVSLRCLKQFRANAFRKMCAYVQHGVPIRLVATHIINANLKMSLVLKLVRSCMVDKSLLHVHSSIESLQLAIGKFNLPMEYGGKNSSVVEGAQELFQQLREYTNYFKDNQKYGFINRKLERNQ